MRPTYKRYLICLAASLSGPIIGAVSAQYYVAPRPGAPVAQPVPVPVPVPGVAPGYGYPTPPGYWIGSGGAIDAYANLGVSQEQARVVREQANQAKLETQKQTVDVMAYERANKYWYSDEKADIQSKKVQAAMNSPPLAEVTSGRALNTLLEYINAVMAKGVSFPSIPVDPQIVQEMNVTSGEDGGNAGLLRNINNLEWPTATLGNNQTKLNDMLKQATYEAVKAPIPPALASQLNKQTDLVSDDVRSMLRKNECDGSEYILANRFLDQVREATKALRQPSITKTLAGQGGPQGQSVSDVVYNMASRGLNFAAAQPGHENAYVAMHNAFVSFGQAVGPVDTSFRLRVGSLPNTPTKQ